MSDPTTEPTVLKGRSFPVTSDQEHVSFHFQKERILALLQGTELNPQPLTEVDDDTRVMIKSPRHPDNLEMSEFIFLYHQGFVAINATSLSLVYVFRPSLCIYPKTHHSKLDKHNRLLIAQQALRLPAHHAPYHYRMVLSPNQTVRRHQRYLHQLLITLGYVCSPFDESTQATLPRDNLMYSLRLNALMSPSIRRILDGHRITVDAYYSCLPDVRRLLKAKNIEWFPASMDDGYMTYEIRSKVISD